MKHRSEKPLGRRKQRYFNEKAPVNVRVAFSGKYRGDVAGTHLDVYSVIRRSELHSCVRTVSKPICLSRRAYLSSEKQKPQVIVNKRKSKQAMEGLEMSRRLAKQVLSQLSYTPTAGTITDFNAFAAVRKLRNASLLLK